MQVPPVVGSVKSTAVPEAPGGAAAVWSAGQVIVTVQACPKVTVSTSVCGGAPKPSPALLSVTSIGPVKPAGTLTVTVNV